MIDAGLPVNDAGTQPIVDAGVTPIADAGGEMPAPPMGCGCMSGEGLLGLAFLSLFARRRSASARAGSPPR